MTNIEKQILKYEIATGQSVYGEKLTRRQIAQSKSKLRQGEKTEYELQI